LMRIQLTYPRTSLFSHS